MQHIDEYCQEASRYIQDAPLLSPGQKKRQQLKLSSDLSKVLLHDLGRVAHLVAPLAKETMVAGSFRRQRADFVDFCPTEGLRVAAEMKPVHLAVGRSIWNRVGDLRAFSANVHGRFRYATVGCLMSVPLWEYLPDGRRRSTYGLIQRLIAVLTSERRVSPADPDHMAEARCLLVFDPETGSLENVTPDLSWNVFVADLASAMARRACL